ncbi:hypothetical protein D9599_12520 [Roseomonas sp. KE2513]|uniref:tripartite tricarboxylate transporter substrate-binding protein n=1 Tax=Roseomonas sp. KE2513 TaxID=2479202 RepID=UPI0018DF31F3|nr:tripartite tricarboxylate transporter substrate-binding protein [Roseomonas sp. KE2513]MBI0536400.1 hypothetical protein [Roseomonas sp. KE2513]
MIRRRSILGGAALLAVPGAARAQLPTPYVAPGGRSRSMTLLVGAEGGSGADLWVRGFAPFLERHIKEVQVSVVNRPGEGGLAALRELTGSPTNGSVLAYAPTPFLVARMVERRATGILDKLRLMGAVTEEPVALVAAPGTELSTLRSPGSNRPLGLPPPVSAGSIMAVELAQFLPMEQLHFPSASAARQAAASGNVAAALVNVPDAVVAAREGRLAVLAIAAAARHPQLPDVPTLREEGIALDAALRRGIAVPAGIEERPAAHIARALRAAAADPEFLAQAEWRAVLPRFRDEAEWGAIVRQDLVELRTRWETAPWQVVGG